MQSDEEQGLWRGSFNSNQGGNAVGLKRVGFNVLSVQTLSAVRPSCCAWTSFTALMAPPQHRGQSLYSLTSLQLGDLQSYISKLYLHVGKKKLVFFVDNEPWSAERSKRSKPVEFWQLMVTQSRISPFANRSLGYASIDRENAEDMDTSTANVLNMSSKRKLFHVEQSRLGKLFRDIFRARLRSVVHMQELSHLLYGCVTFELEWKNIRGINYVNELQTDTCVALEIKLLVKRVFHNIKDASAFYGIERPEVFVTTSPWRFSQESSLESNNSCANAESHSATLSSDELCLENNFQRVDDNHRDDQCYFSDSDGEFFDAVCQFDRAVPFNTDSYIPDRLTRTGLSVDGSCDGGSSVDGELDAVCSDAGLSVDGELDVDCSYEFFNAIQCSCKHKEESRKDIFFNSREICVCPHLPFKEKRHLVESDSATPDSPPSSNISDDTGSMSSMQDDDDDEEASRPYRDILLIFRFCDPILPLELGQIITADQRLLKMLESGLPSWVIFLQSYPIVRKLYRPWMRPLAKTMYILVSIITVIIGFYDLYKNVPVLKATAARICGPFFQWIEAWEMVSRVKYLGTVIFLQNWEKAFRWLLLVFGTVRKLSNLILQPLVGPLEEFIELIWPAWNLILDSVWEITSLCWMMCSSVLQLIVLPIIWLLTAISSLATWVLYPIVSAFWGLIILPIRLVMMLIDCVVTVICYFYKAIQSFWVLVNSTFKLLSVAGPQAERAASSSASTLQLLWNDIFSRVFRAVRSIVNVFVAFFTTCNRHRLSIYNHMEAFFLNLRDLIRSAPLRISSARHQGGSVDEVLKRSSRGTIGGRNTRLKSRKRSGLADK